MTKTIFVLNGPNLNLLGEREPDTYGRETLDDIMGNMRAALPGGFVLDTRQSNIEGELVTWIQEARGKASAIIINPAAYSHTSIAILDALNTYEGPVVEVHISNIHQRERFRHHSYVSSRADAVVAGLGSYGYIAALSYIVQVIG